MGVMEKAQKKAREAIESTYEGLLTVTEHKPIKDGRTKLTDFQDIIVLQDQPCRLSFETISTASQSSSAASVTQSAKLLVSPDIRIKEGSKLTVTQAGMTADYTCSGTPAVYFSHQEIMLDLFERWA